MKLRIQDNSVRFRISIRELEQLSEAGELVGETRIPGSHGVATVFRYVVRRGDDREESTLEAEPFGLTLVLTNADLEHLQDCAEEGVYLKREWLEQGDIQRFLVFIEKDRPGSTCVKQEAWVYQYHHGGIPTVVPRTKD